MLQHAWFTFMQGDAVDAVNAMVFWNIFTFSPRLLDLSVDSE
jgi:hypothetical protein